MIIAGAGGHARELIDLINPAADEGTYFLFDNVTGSLPNEIGGLAILRTEAEAQKILKEDPRFIIGTGIPSVRRKLHDLFTSWGGKVHTVISPHAFVSRQHSTIEAGVNIMSFSFISNYVHIGAGSLINTRATVHHDVRIGAFCEVGPGAILLGKVSTGDNVFIGAGAVILPGIAIGDNAVIGAGSVVTKNVAAGKTVKGNPAG